MELIDETSEVAELRVLIDDTVDLYFLGEHKRYM